MESRELSKPSQLVIRNIEKITGSNLLVLNCPDEEVGVALKEKLPESTLTLFYFDYADYKRVQTASAEDKNVTTVFNHWHTSSSLHDTTIVYLPKSKPLIEYVLTLASLNTAHGGKVVVVGENDGGIRSAKKDIERLIGPITANDAARHCVWFEAEKKTEISKQPEEFISRYEAMIGEVSFTVCNLPGVFSLGKLDAGTKLLLESLTLQDTQDTSISDKIPHIDLHTKITLLDIACGSGVIGMYLKKISPESVIHLSDVNALSLESARLTMEANKVSNVRIIPSDVFSDIDEKYDLIISNPPFHQGIKTSSEASERLIKEAPHHLATAGKLRLVFNTFLGYDKLMNTFVGKIRIVTENTSYKVCEAEKLKT
ncbi:MAG TPA: class I SAM-dependent methyltransferase [Candidatus Paceibacterota bacterium]